MYEADAVHTREAEESADVGCLLLQVTLTYRERVIAVECPGVSSEVLGTLRSAERRNVRDWWKYAQLRDAAQSAGLPGIAVVYLREADSKKFTPPQPISLRFEPIVLDKTHPSLSHLCSAEEIEGRPQHAPMPESRFRRAVRRFVRPGVLVAGIMIYAVLEMGPLSLLGAILVASVAALAALVAISATRWRAGQWFLVPGGLVVRTARFPSFATEVHRCTPRDSTVTVKRTGAGWRATVYQDRWWKSHSLSELECFALLGAWQSPLRPPALEKMVDLK